MRAPLGLPLLAAAAVVQTLLPRSGREYALRCCCREWWWSCVALAACHLYRSLALERVACRVIVCCLLLDWQLHNALCTFRRWRERQDIWVFGGTGGTQR